MNRPGRNKIGTVGRSAGSHHVAGDGPARGVDPDGPEAALWAALLRGGPDGVPITDLMIGCGMGRSWVYYRLREHGRAGRAVQSTRRSWRAVRPGDGRPPGHPGTGRPPGPRGDGQDRPSVHGIARACARGAAHRSWTWTWTITIGYRRG